MLGVRVKSRGGRPGSNRRLRGSQPRVLPVYTTATTDGDDRTRTGGLSPDKRVLYAAELRPRGKASSAGGIRTHGLELMRLARTAAPLPRRSGRQESNLRSPAPEAGGVACSPTTRRDNVRLRRQGSNLPLAINSRASYRLDHAGTDQRTNGRMRWPRQASNLHRPG